MVLKGEKKVGGEGRQRGRRHWWKAPLPESEM